MSYLINETSDLLHEIIYSIDNSNKDISFPVTKITNYLESEGYIFTSAESHNGYVVMRKVDNNSKVVITGNAVLFNKIENDCKEKYKQTFYKYLISRAKIYYQSAVQNNKAAKINLLQNQRRTSISNMYYSLHNGFAALIEFYKLEDLSDDIILEILNEEEESKLEHFTPVALAKFLENIDDILINEKEHFLNNELMNAGRMNSLDNPFSWLYPLFEQKMEDEKFETLVFKIEESLKNIELDNIAIDSGSRRFRFETQLKNLLSEILTLMDEPSILREKKLLITFAGFISYAYMLRQLADYDSLFEVKTSLTEIINWTILSSDILDFIGDYIKEERITKSNIIQKLEAESSREILKNPDLNYNNVFFTITGIIVAKNFNLVDLIKGLYSHRGYKMLNHNGEYTELNNRNNEVIISRVLFSTKLECLITISKQGLFRIDVQAYNNIDNEGYIKSVNLFYLEKLIVSEIIERDIASRIPNNSNIVIGIPTTSLKTEFTYYELYTGINDSNTRMLDMNLRRFMESLIDDMSTDEVLIVPKIQLFKTEPRFNFIRRFSRLFERNTFEREEAVKESINQGILKEINHVVFHNIEVLEEMKERVQNELEKEFENIKINCEFISLSDSDIKEIIEGNLDLLRSKVVAYRESIKREKVEVKNLITEEVVTEELEGIDSDLNDGSGNLDNN